MSTSKINVGRAVDWGFAATVGAKLVRPGPAATDYTRRQVIDQLASAALRAEMPVREVTGLNEGGELPDARIIDRTQWIRAATQSMRVMTGGSDDGDRPHFITGRVTGAQTGAVLAFISSGILGQYDPFGPGGGELLLVYPNVISVERQLRVQPADFRLWVCLHEETHRVQFTAVPWLRGYLNDQIAQIVDSAELDPTIVAQMLREALRRVVEGLSHNEEVSIIDLVQTPAQRETVDRVTAVMSLLEGHADVIMDSVGPEIIPTVQTIRSKFTVRRQGQGIDKIIRRLLGLDAKLRQYRDGAAFCRAVLAQVGMAGLNRVWTSPETLPSPAEIADPQLWLTRMHPELTVG